MHMIHPTLKIDKHLEEYVVTQFEKSIGTLDASDLDRVKNRLPKIVSRLRRKRVGWCSDLAGYADAIFRELVDRNQSLAVHVDATAIAEAALVYLCNTHDVIPDYTPGVGYVDDAIVINQCLSVIRRRDNGCFRRIKARVLAR